MKTLVPVENLMGVAINARISTLALIPVRKIPTPVVLPPLMKKQGFQQSQLATLNAIASLTSHKKAIEEQEKTMKAALYDAMMKFGVKKFESDVLNLTLVEPTTSTTIDSAKLKKKYPAIAAECSKPNPKAGYVKITLKGGGQ